MSAIKQPDFYIGVTRDPPAIVSIGKTIDGMQVMDFVLNSELNEDKKRNFENAIDKIESEPEPDEETAVEQQALNLLANPVESARIKVEQQQELNRREAQAKAAADAKAAANSEAEAEAAANSAL